MHDRSTPLRQPESTYREVRAGDTLYSIAWESGRDYRDVAAWNGLEAPYLIKPGQRIRLYPPGKTAHQKTDKVETEKPAKPESGYRVVAKGDTLYGIAKTNNVRYQDLAAWNSLKPPYQLKPGQRLRIASPNAARVSSPPAALTKPVATSKRAVADDDGGRTIDWIWPTEGQLLARFSPTDAAKGIDIAGTSGQVVRAAAPGKVVYQGSGLRGYGQLIIIKHNADFLSAYAHCAEIFVQEGSVIKPGQKIAAMGSTGTDRTKLHFEIRRRGVPVDPLEFLPKK